MAAANLRQVVGPPQIKTGSSRPAAGWIVTRRMNEDVGFCDNNSSGTVRNRVTFTEKRKYGGLTSLLVTSEGPQNDAWITDTQNTKHTAWIWPHRQVEDEPRQLCGDTYLCHGGQGIACVVLLAGLAEPNGWIGMKSERQSLADPRQ